MTLKVLCAGYLVRFPIGGHTWHHLQYLVGLQRLGHDVLFVEDFGWAGSCYHAGKGAYTDDPAFGIGYLRDVLRPFGLDDAWCFLSTDGRALGRSREELADFCASADLVLNLSGMNWIPEFLLCRRRALVDTDPVFTQLGSHGMAGPLERYNVLFTYGENVHRPGCDMPTAGQRWLPTRQPIVLDAWPVTSGDPSAPITTVMNWTGQGDRSHGARTYGQKDREFGPFFTLPRDTNLPMALVVNAPPEVVARMRRGGWAIEDALAVSRTPWSYQAFLRASRAEFCVAKHAYVSTRCGWFSDRSSAYLALGRPVVVQDTGFSDFLPTGRGLVAFRTPADARAGLASVVAEYAAHCAAARELVASHFAADRVLSDLLTAALT